MSLPVSPAARTRTNVRVWFGRPSNHLEGAAAEAELGVALPVLAGAPDEALLTGAETAESGGGWTFFRTKSRLAGCAVAPPDLDVERAAAGLYRQLFAAARGRHLYRVWNYVPRINAVEDGLENYRRFCRGRSLAFEQHFGPDFKKLLPAASAVGSAAGPLALAFVAGDAPPHHFENPRQVPAFEYPPQYGPRPPSFARATAIADDQSRRVYLSGTSSIQGHATVAPGDLAGQLACTLENLRLIATTAGVEDAAGWRRAFKVYLRRAADQPAAAARLAREFLQPDDTVQYLQADICRAELLVEIEGVLTASAIA
jgi:hypothetical protein